MYFFWDIDPRLAKGRYDDCAGLTPLVKTALPERIGMGVVANESFFKDASMGTKQCPA